MTEKTEEQLLREKLAVDAMRNAKSSMVGALERIATLEHALRGASSAIRVLKGYIAPDVYIYGNANKKCVTVADEALAEIAKVAS